MRIKAQETSALTLNGDPGLGEEGYELSITTDSIFLRAVGPAGLFYGVQTLRQLLPAHPSTDPQPACRFDTRYPRFEWRGAMLDVARHFFGVEDVKRYIDLISHYKMNRLHLHLTDDQGWRIEIKSWPRLTEVGRQNSSWAAAAAVITLRSNTKRSWSTPAVAMS